MPSIYTPFVYLIGWSSRNKYYFGVRYAKGCHPSDLWERYFTSSKHVKRFVDKHGDPDILEIRKTFSCREEACKWENKVIRRMNMVNDEHWLNYTNNMAILKHHHNPIENLKGCKKYNDWDEETKKRVKEKRRKNAIKMHQLGLISYEKPEDTTNYKNAAIKRWSDPEFKKRFMGQRWMRSPGGSTSKKVSPEDQQTFLDNGWSFGRVFKKDPRKG